MDAWMNKTVLSADPKRMKAPDSELQHCVWTQRMGLTWWECLAVFQYVILECAGCAGCQAVECVHVCVTDECESVSKSTRWLKRAMWLPVVSWRALLWWKVICFPEERPVPSFLPLLRHRPSTPTPGPGDPSNYTNCINCTVKEDRVGQRIPMQWLFYCFYSDLDNLSVCVCMCVRVRVRRALTEFCWKYKMNYEDDSVSVALSPNSIPTPSAEYLSSAEDFRWTDLSKDDNQHWCCCYIVFALQHSSKVIVVMAGLECHIKNRAVRRTSWGIYECVQMALGCIVKIKKWPNKEANRSAREETLFKR